MSEDNQSKTHAGPSDDDSNGVEPVIKLKVKSSKQPKNSLEDLALIMWDGLGFFTFDLKKVPRMRRVAI